MESKLENKILNAFIGKVVRKEYERSKGNNH